MVLAVDSARNKAKRYFGTVQLVLNEAKTNSVHLRHDIHKMDEENGMSAKEVRGGESMWAASMNLHLWSAVCGDVSVGGEDLWGVYLRRTPCGGVSVKDSS